MRVRCCTSYATRYIAITPVILNENHANAIRAMASGMSAHKRQADDDDPLDLPKPKRQNSEWAGSSSMWQPQTQCLKSSKVAIAAIIGVITSLSRRTQCMAKSWMAPVILAHHRQKDPVISRSPIACHPRIQGCNKINHKRSVYQAGKSDHRNLSCLD